MGTVFMLCQDLMKRDVKRVAPQTTVEDAAAMMRDEGVGFLPVCDETGRVLGTITDRDIVIRNVAGREPASNPVESIMTGDVVTCRGIDDLRYAEELMMRAKVSRIVCVDTDGTLEGVISLSDIAQIEEQPRAAETLRGISERETHTRLVPGSSPG